MHVYSYIHYNRRVVSVTNINCFTINLQGGRMKRSEVYFSLDCRLPGAGLNLATTFVNQTVAVETTLLSQCSSSGSSSSTRQQLLQLFGHPPACDSAYTNSNVSFFWQPSLLLADTSDRVAAQTCVRNESLLFKHRLRSQPDLQRAIADFCWMHVLSEKNCGLLTASVYSHIARLFMATERALPRSQQLPSVQNPFIFIHIEKTGGTTMRE